MSDVMPEGAAPEAPAPETPEPGFTIDPQEWQQTQQALQELAQIVQPQPPPWQQQPQGPPIPDPFAEDYAQQFQQYIEYAQAPMRQWQEQQQLNAAQEEAMQTLSGLAEQGGAFDQGAAWARANQIILENGGDPYKALEKAAADQRAFESQLRAQAVEEYKQQLQAAGGHRGPMPVGANGAQTVPVGGYGNQPGAVTARLFGGG